MTFFWLLEELGDGRAHEMQEGRGLGGASGEGECATSFPQTSRRSTICKPDRAFHEHHHEKLVLWVLWVASCQMWPSQVNRTPRCQFGVVPSLWLDLPSYPASSCYVRPWPPVSASPRRFAPTQHAKARERADVRPALVGEQVFDHHLSFKGCVLRAAPCRSPLPFHIADT